MFLFYFVVMFGVGLFFGAVLLHLLGHRNVNLRSVGFSVGVAATSAAIVALLGLWAPGFMWIWGFECIAVACIAHIWVRPDYVERTVAKIVWSIMLLLPLLGPAAYLVFSGSPDEEWAVRRMRHSNAVAAKWVVEWIAGT